MPQGHNRCLEWCIKKGVRITCWYLYVATATHLGANVLLAAQLVIQDVETKLFGKKENKLES